MTYAEKSQKSHTSIISTLLKMLIFIELWRNRNSFHGSPTYYFKKTLSLLNKLKLSLLWVMQVAKKDATSVV